MYCGQFKSLQDEHAVPNTVEYLAILDPRDDIFYNTFT